MNKDELSMDILYHYIYKMEHPDLIFQVKIKNHIKLMNQTVKKNYEGNKIEM